jgi:hypothetical protein
MTTFFCDYSWKAGKPVGKGVVKQDSGVPFQSCYKIVIDPYYKRISVESYQAGKWHSLVYDSALLDFRKLNERDQMAWQRETILSLPDEAVCLIRDHDDRVICMEKHRLKDNIPISCEILSPQGILLAIQKMHYTALGDLFNGVTFLDSTGRQVLKKVYAVDEQTFEFTDLLEEIQA